MKETWNKTNTSTVFLIFFLMDGVYPQGQMQSFQMYMKQAPSQLWACNWPVSSYLERF